VFSRIVFSAAIAGLLAGLLWTVLQQVWVVPLILEAETYETAAPPEPAAATGDGHAHHEHDAEAWAPSDGLERLLYTGLGNVVLAIGFGLLLVVGYALRNEVTWKQGLLWGLAGFATFSLAPALGLPPELPGAAAAALESRQVWWLATVLLTGGGLVMLAFLRQWVWRIGGVLLILLPHVIGAPHPEAAGGLAPPELERQFIVASLATSAVLWIVLGALTASFFNRMGGSVGHRFTAVGST
jgi:cobalt transporter subunit CbtA